ncbi:MAG TPA: FtsX-like permease family protein [Thermoanaerobaculia bacterium]|nr:FtsX-like permease family protein [Thermoanaerobaculia bacterium]
MKGFFRVFRALVSGPARRHPMRLVLPIVGVAVGVAAVAAIHHANRSVTQSFRDAASTVSGRSDFTVTGVSGIPVEALRRFSFLWSIGSFAPAVTGVAVLDDGSGEIVDLLGVDIGGDSAVRDWSLLESDGRAAIESAGSRDGVFVPVGFARRHRLLPGASFRVVAGGVPRTLRVAGRIATSGIARAAGDDLLITDVFTAQKLLGKAGRVDRVDVVLRPGEDRSRAVSALAARLPAGLRIDPPNRSAASADRMVRAFRFNLNALGSLTLLVGVFLIANAVSISVLRRRPEIATLKAVGASRPLVFAVFLVEGVAVGLVGTALGEVAGLFLARAALRAVSGTVSSVYLPASHITGSGYLVPALLAACVGLAASVAAAVLPAIEATRVSPSPAMRAGSVEAVRRRRLGVRTAAAGASLLLGGAACLAPPVDGFPLAGFAAVLFVVIALALVAPLLVRSGAALLRRPLRSVFGAPGPLGARFFGGALARNGIAVTALAMALGMTLAMIVTVASIRETVRVWVESTLRSDLWIKASAGSASGIVGDLPEEVVGFLDGFPGVAAVDPFRAREADRDGRPFTLASGDFRVVARLGGLPFLGGQNARETASRARREGAVLVSEPFARRFGVRAGEPITLPTPGGPRSFPVGGIYRDYSNDRGTVILDRQLYISLFDDRRVTSVAVVAAAGTDPVALRRRILAASAGRFALSITTNRDLRREVLRIFDRTFAVTRGLEAIAVAVAILGIANALLASAVERRRAFGLLRAIGSSRRQIRRAVLVEALLTGLVATGAAVAAGAAFAWILLGVINPQSFGWTVSLDVPFGALAGAAALVLAASIAAGILPGSVAAGVNPAAALAEE